MFQSTSRQTAVGGWWVACGLMWLAGIQSAWGQATSPFTVTATSAGAATSRIQMITDDFLGSTTWELTSGLTAFQISHNGGGSSIFQITRGAPLHSLSIHSTGRLMCSPGKIDNPAADLHVLSPTATATLRLETPTLQSDPRQAWQLEGSAGVFSLKDFGNVPNNDLVLTPFAVEVDTPTNTLRLKSTGHVGLGTANPATRLHVVESAKSGTESVALFQVGDDTVGKLAISNAASVDGIFIPKIQGTSASQNAALIMEGQITNDVGASPAIVYNAFKAGAGALVTRPLVVYRNNGVAKVTVAANGDVFATSFSPSSSRALKDRIVDLESRKAVEALRHLTPVEYVYKDDPTAEPRVGFIAEDVPELVANADRRSVPIMDVVAVLTRVVQDQDKQLDEQRRLNSQLQQSLAALSQRMAELEQQRPGASAPAK